jgi:hypothetical protein
MKWVQVRGEWRLISGVSRWRWLALIRKSESATNFGSMRKRRRRAGMKARPAVWEVFTIGPEYKGESINPQCRPKSLDKAKRVAWMSVRLTWPLEETR